MINSGATPIPHATRSKACRSQKVDLHITKDIEFGGARRVQLVAEVFNLFNHANYGAYNVSLSPTSAATTALFGTPATNSGTAYVSRQGQLGFKVMF